MPGVIEVSPVMLQTGSSYTEVVVEALLLVLIGSFVMAVTLTELDTEPAADGVVTTVNVLDSNAASAPTSKVTVCSDMVLGAPEAETIVWFGPRTSVTTIPLATVLYLSELFVTTMV